ncbi:MAG: hypothetical protein CL758_00775 [Chloroflexi bacterium]|nr:hypothetical protein [Chloroflexota bacterium]|tara:strand:- start:5181 stop:6344 length:1164 start_codon:yes stop_codon:yes gene_type:complete
MISPKLPNINFDNKTNNTTDDLKNYFTNQGYTTTETSLIEESDIFTRKSGVKLSSKLYSFIDPGGQRVSLRPEFTTSIIKIFLNEYTNNDLPLKFQYYGPVFGYNPSQNKGLEQRTQIGIELLGQNGVEIDTDILAMAIKSLKLIKIDNIEITIGNLEFLNNLLSFFDLSNPAKNLVLNNIQLIQSKKLTTKALINKAEKLGILNQNINKYKNNHPKNNPLDFSAIILKENLNSSMGQRSSDDIIDRLYNKNNFSDDLETLKNVINLIKSLSSIKGKSEKALNETRKILNKNSLPEKLLLPLEQISDSIEKSIGPNTNIQIAPTHIRGLEYYTGLIFDINYRKDSELIHLGGGGRYDELVQVLGGTDKIPALGFAFSIENIQIVLNN